MSRFIVFVPRHLYYLLAEFTEYYNGTRSIMVREHLSSVREIPEEVETLKLDQIVVRRHVSRIISLFERKVA